MRVEDCYYINYNNQKYPVVGISLNEHDKHELNDEPCQYLLFGDKHLAQVLEPFDTKDKADIDNQIIFYFDDNVCQRYLNGNISDSQLFKIVKGAVLSW